MCVFDETGHHFYAKENYLGGKVLWLEKKRQWSPYHYNHVVMRGNNRQIIFSNSADYQAFFSCPAICPSKIYI